MPSETGEHSPWQPSASQVMPGPSQAKLLSLVPVASHTVAFPVADAQDAALGMHFTHPRPSLHSEGHSMVLEKPPCPSQTLATLPSHTVWPYGQTVPASGIGGGGSVPPAPPTPDGAAVISLDAHAPNKNAKIKQQGLLSSMAVNGRATDAA